MAYVDAGFTRQEAMQLVLGAMAVALGAKK
jgi:hypothetical protein